MKKKGWGRIITVTTSFFTMIRQQFHPYVSILPSWSPPAQSVTRVCVLLSHLQGPVKAALEAMTAGHAAEFDGTGITVNVVVPGGPTDTPMVTKEDYPDRSQLIPPSAMTRPGTAPSHA